MNMKIVRRPRPWRFPRPKRFPKPKIKKGGVFEFNGEFPYKFVSHLNAVKAPYNLIHTKRGIRIEINGKPKRPGATVVRTPKDISYNLEIDILEDISAKHKEKHPELFEKLTAMQERFVRLGRKTTVHCPRESSRPCKAVVFCLARCDRHCDELGVDKLMGVTDDKAEFFRDLLKLQRLVNVIYGTVRDEDHFKDEQEGT